MKLLTFAEIIINITYDKMYNLAESGISLSFELVEQEIRYYLHVRT